jgi:hypothetical protein
LRRFVGDFDNFAQVERDRTEGLAPREGGGHEHIHCCVRRLALPAVAAADGDSDALLAIYYFDGSPAKLFRVRCYTLHGGQNKDASLEMRLWRVPPAVVAAAAQAAPRGAEVASSAAAVALLAAGLQACNALDGCEVHWSFGPAVAGSASKLRSLVATMEGGGCMIESEREPGRFIRVEDDLTLNPQEVALGSDGCIGVGAMLQINDRGFDVPSGAMVYGNWRGVPYALARVEPGSDLAWTLGG